MGTAAHTFARPSGTEHFDLTADDEVVVRDEAAVEVAEGEADDPSEEAPRRGRPRKYTRGDV